MGEISLPVFTKLWDERFTLWDSDKNGDLDSNELSNGLNSVVGPPPGMMGGPGGKGNPPGMDGPPGF